MCLPNTQFIQYACEIILWIAKILEVCLGHPHPFRNIYTRVTLSCDASSACEAASDCKVALDFEAALDYNAPPTCEAASAGDTTSSCMTTASCIAEDLLGHPHPVRNLYM